MDSPTIIIRASPLSFLGVSGVIFIQFFDENSISKQNSPRYDARSAGVTSGAILFVYVP